MQNAFLIQVIEGISPEEEPRLRKFLQSPLHNLREDVLLLFDWIAEQRKSASPVFDKAAAFAAVYPGKKYDADVFNLVMRYLLDRIEHFLAYEEWNNDPVQFRLSLIRALRKREISEHFERQVRRLGNQQQERTERHAGFYLAEYQLQNEILEHRIVGQRNWQENLPAITAALAHFFALENLRWSGMTAALRLRLSAVLDDPPLAAAVDAFAGAPGQPLSVMLQYFSKQVMAEPDNELYFNALCEYLPQSSGLFPPAQCRDLYMTAINFCIRRQNKGDRAYTQKALGLYRQAFEKGILLENGALPKYTYNNIAALAHLAGEGDWAEQFIESARDLLLPHNQQDSYRYNLAICFFRKGNYSKTLDLLREVDSSETFIQIDIRRMLLRVYFELHEWMALDSLLGSFKAYLLRKKDLGYHRDSYLNLIRFTQKLISVQYAKCPQRQALAEKIEKTQQVAEKEWLLGKLG